LKIIKFIIVLSETLKGDTLKKF